MANDIMRLNPTPLRTPRTLRNHELSVLTSMPAGKAVPIAAFGMLREEAMSARVRIAVEMAETAEILMNGVDLKVSAYLVPWLAFERFEGSRDQFDRSYAGEKKTDDVGAVVVPFFDTYTAPSEPLSDVWKYLGLHCKVGDTVNRAYVQAYNLIHNFRAKNRSKGISLRAMNISGLSPAFWNHSQWQYAVPNFDQAVIDGEVALNVLDRRAPVSGLGIGARNATMRDNASVLGYTGASTFPKSYGINDLGTANASGEAELFVRMNATTGFTDVYAELAASGISVSLSNLEMAKKTQAFAKLRKQFEGFDDEYIIDMLMNGMSIAEQQFKQPMLLAQKITRFGQAKRYATDAGNLAESAVSGGAVIDMAFRCPRISVGGVVMLIAEAVPQQLFERSRDWLSHCTSTEQLPEFMRDELDPEKVDVILNGAVDSDHATPNGVFGYEPLNARFNRSMPRVGGKFFRPTANAGTDTDRQRLWAVETINPVLAESFYVVSSIHTKPFLDTVADPFEATVAGNAVLEGNTVFGGQLVEATNNYAAIAAEQPTTRIVKP